MKRYLGINKEKSYEYVKYISKSSLYFPEEFIDELKKYFKVWKIMKKKIVSYLSYGSLIIGAVIGVYALVDIYIIKTKLPSGICSVTSNKFLLYISK